MSIVVCTGGTSHAGRSGVPDNAAATTDRRERPAAARRFAATHPRTASYTQRGVPRRPGAASAGVTVPRFRFVTSSVRDSRRAAGPAGVGAFASAGAPGGAPTRPTRRSFTPRAVFSVRFPAAYGLRLTA